MVNSKNGCDLVQWQRCPSERVISAQRHFDTWNQLRTSSAIDVKKGVIVSTINDCYHPLRPSKASGLVIAFACFYADHIFIGCIFSARYAE